MANSRLLFQQLLRNFTLSIDSSEKEAILFLIMKHQFHLSRVDVMIGKKIEADEELLKMTIKRLNNSEPVQYILGEADFYGRTFSVNPSVLIPRPETELLVGAVVDRFSKNNRALTILDIGTGSGCIAITLSLELATSKVIATDISNKALAVAKENADRLMAPVQFESHDIVDNALNFGPLDIVVSNPPYITESEKNLMSRNVLEFEPSTALFVPNNDPLLFYKAIAKKACDSLTPGGFLITEINEQLGNETNDVFKHKGFTNVEILRDLEGKDRFVCGYKA